MRMTKKLSNQLFIEKLLYVLLLLIITVNIAVGILVIETNHKLDKQVIAAKNISATNQKYIRCVILITRHSVYRVGDDQQVAKVLDDCAVKSKLPY